jgi:beta-aspartyl-peptidase (threonine type)
LKEALEMGFSTLKDGGSALDATMEAVIVFENNHLYNAGKGAVYTSKETHEMDAATMDGHTLNSGAACFVSRVKNPIKLARAILEKSPHALLCGEGAEDFARNCHLELVENSYFDDEYRYNQLLKAKQEKTIVRDHDISVEKPMGTVGAVALDSHGNLAASTSTGGTTNKSVGRIGDTPLI